MRFIWPFMLWTLLVVPVIVALYLRIQRQRLAQIAAFDRFGAGQTASRRAPGFRRHVPALFFLLGLVISLVALARPQAQISLPRVEGTVMLVLDVSGSMAATDADPSRLAAAKAAASEFVLSQPPTVQIGVVSFSSSGFAIEPPTSDTDALLDTIARLEPATGTSLGQGILSALHTIAVDAGLVTDETVPVEDVAAAPVAPADTEQEPPALDRRDEALLAQLPVGAYPASVIVLLSDGEHNESLDPLRAAEAAAERGVPISALGFGTPAGIALEVDGFYVHTALDEATLQQVAAATGGTYFSPGAQQDLQQVYASLSPQLVVKPEDMEITSVLAGASMVLLLAGSLFSMLWFNRLL
jgi:Ca-activated chloride channel homolog